MSIVLWPVRQIFGLDRLDMITKPSRIVASISSQQQTTQLQFKAILNYAKTDLNVRVTL